MAYILKDLVVDRVDLVDEGANSAAFIELYKRKENPMDFNEIVSKLKPEHAEVIKQALADKDAELAKAREDLTAKEAELTTANDALAKANAELEKAKECDGECECDGEEDENGMCKACGKPKKKSCKKAASEEELIKSMPDSVRSMFEKMRAQKEAAEEQVRKNAEEKVEAEAIAKAASLKALPIEQDKLVGLLKGISPEMLDLLTKANAAIEGETLDEVGKNRGNGASDTSAPWAQIEAKAEEIAKRDNVTKEKAIAKAVDENPELYAQYLEGGAN